jgi:4-aminobutyrate aminotransferase-like enzyme/GNAT superfamily N-acetyltransferase
MSAVKAPSWVKPQPVQRASASAKRKDVRVRRISGTEFDALADRIESIETRSYEPERQDDIETLGKIAKGLEAIGLIAELEGQVVGFSFAGPLEHFRHVQGPDADAEMGRGTTLYSADVTVAPDFRGCGVGSMLKEEQLRQALGARHEDGSARFAFVTGRNRVGHTAEMSSINTKFGGYTVATYKGQYGSSDGVAEYYRIPLRRMDRRVMLGGAMGGMNLEDGIQEPLDARHEELRSGLSRGCFNGGMLTKLTLSNFTTPNVVRYVELMKEVRPQGMEHMYLTSCRDEMIDKAIRTLRSHRKEGEVCLSFSGAFLGQTTAGARSLSDWEGVPFGERMPWFDWPQVSHPTGGAYGDGEKHSDLLEKAVEGGSFDSDEGLDAFMAGLDLGDTALSQQVSREAQSLRELQTHIMDGGSDRIIGVFAESVQEKTGQTFSQRMWRGLGQLLKRADVPLVMDEVTTGLGRSGQGLWRSNTLPVQPEAILFYAGGQLGHVFVSDRYFLPKPLQLISTWDGDEVSALRVAWLLRALRSGNHQSYAQAFEGAVRKVATGAGCSVGGEGLYVAIQCPAGRAEQVRSALRSRGVSVGVGTQDRILLAPSLTVKWGTEQLSTLSKALGEAL